MIRQLIFVWQLVSMKLRLPRKKVFHHDTSLTHTWAGAIDKIYEIDNRLVLHVLFRLIWFYQIFGYSLKWINSWVWRKYFSNCEMIDAAESYFLNHNKFNYKENITTLQHYDTWHILNNKEKKMKNNFCLCEAAKFSNTSRMHVYMIFWNRHFFCIICIYPRMLYKHLYL